MSSKKVRERAEAATLVRKIRNNCPGSGSSTKGEALAKGKGAWLCKKCGQWHHTEAVLDALGSGRRHGRL